MNVLLKYLRSNIFLSLVVVYFMVAVILMSSSVVDIGIPCFWKSLFGFKCPGCGLTRASMSLARLDLKGAFLFNPLVFIIIPAIGYYILTDFLRFYKKNKTK